MATEDTTSTRPHCGVYIIQNTDNGRVYVGSSINLSHRIGVHKCYLRSGKHNNHVLQSDWNLYGEHAFTFQLVEPCGPDMLIQREQFWLDRYVSIEKNNLYNLCLIAGSCLGLKHKEGSSVRKSLALRGNIVRSKEWSLNRSRLMSGRKLAEYHKLKIQSAFLKYRPLTDEQILSIRDRLANGGTLRQLATEFGVGTGTIHRIRHHKGHYDIG